MMSEQKAWPKRETVDAGTSPETEGAAVVRRCKRGEITLEEGAKLLGITDGHMKALCEPSADDPLLRLAGVIESELRDVSERHDDYIGQQLISELSPPDNG